MAGGRRKETETAERALKDGRIKTVARTRKDRQADYATLVTGMALQLASTAFTASPVFKEAVVAADTQRRESKTGRLRDEWVFEIELDRGTIESLDLQRVDPLTVLTKAPGRIDLRPTFELRAIQPPSWWSPTG